LVVVTYLPHSINKDRPVIINRAFLKESYWDFVQKCFYFRTYSV